MKKCFLFLIVALMLFGLPAARAQGGNAFIVSPQYPDNQLETRGYLDMAGTPPGTYAVNVVVEYQGSVKNETREFVVEAVEASALPEASASPSPGAPPPGGVFIRIEYVIAFGAAVAAVFIVLFVRPKRRH